MSSASNASNVADDVESSSAVAAASLVEMGALGRQRQEQALVVESNVMMNVNDDEMVGLLQDSTSSTSLSSSSSSSGTAAASSGVIDEVYPVVEQVQVVPSSSQTQSRPMRVRRSGAIPSLRGGGRASASSRLRSPTTISTTGSISSSPASARASNRVAVAAAVAPTRAQRRNWDRRAQQWLLDDRKRDLVQLAWYLYGLYVWAAQCQACARTNFSMYLIFTLTLLVGVLHWTVIFALWLVARVRERLDALEGGAGVAAAAAGGVNADLNNRLNPTWWWRKLITTVMWMVLSDSGRRMLEGLDLTNQFDLETGMNRLARGGTNERMIELLPRRVVGGAEGETKKAEEKEQDEDEKESKSERESESESECDEDSSTSKKSCAICLGEFEAGDCVITLPACFHEFHEECVSRWLMDKTTCPICRNDVQQSLSSSVLPLAHDALDLEADHDNSNNNENISVVLVV